MKRTFRRLTVLDTQICALCGSIACGTEITHGLCTHCRKEIASVHGPFIVAPASEEEAPWVYTATEYGGSIIELIEQIKLAGDTRLVDLAVRFLLAPLYRSIVPFAEKTVLVPIPASRSGRSRRGFDQSLLLAHALARDHEHAMNVAPVLRRSSGADQKHLPRSERFVNIEGQLALVRHAVLPSDRVVLIDDVVTTGASMLAARNLVRMLGTTYCVGLALALRT